jgi:hypothetical protein
MPTNNFKWLLRKALYDLYQAPREWNEVLHKFLTGTGFTQSKRDTCIYIKGNGDRQILKRSVRSKTLSEIEMLMMYYHLVPHVHLGSTLFAIYSSNYCLLSQHRYFLSG